MISAPIMGAARDAPSQRSMSKRSAVCNVLSSASGSVRTLVLSPAQDEK